ncbi:MAG TPA: AAA family ATPase, partial [Gammaproteobacteria bacterium]|nr:AAA family ATPase [Gammaproteobacteria bacterium]
EDLNGFNLQRQLESAQDDTESPNQITPFQRFTNQYHYEDTSRIIEFNAGLVTLEDGETRLRLVLLTDRTDQIQLDSILHSHDHFGIITRDPVMQAIIARAHQVAAVRAAVLLQGESGTGKTLFARMIHQLSSRSEAPFVEVNCGAIPEGLIESELFGHVKGAFTGATQDRPGRFQIADGGTLFLDEIGEIPLHLQAKLLRAVQDQAFERVGSDQTLHVDVRIITASNHNLREMTHRQTFRSDLYYRLAVITLELPPLRDRPGDIPLLARHFIQRFAQFGYPENTEMTSNARQALMDYPWPGNVRELENAIEHGIICAIGGKIRAESLPGHLTGAAASAGGGSRHDNCLSEREQIMAALRACNGVRSAAASRLGIDRSTLWRRMKKHDIH